MRIPSIPQEGRVGQQQEVVACFCAWETASRDAGREQMADFVWWGMHCTKVAPHLAAPHTEVCPRQGGFEIADSIGNEAVKFVERTDMACMWCAWRRGCIGVCCGVDGVLGCWFQATPGEEVPPGQAFQDGWLKDCQNAAVLQERLTWVSTKQWNQGDESACLIPD